MNYYTCDSCHYIFQSDDVPPACPACNTSTVIARDSNGRKFKIPAVRISTRTEIEGCRLADREEKNRQSFSERVKNLSGYSLTDDEYHTALMLLFYFKSAPGQFTSMYLDTLLGRRDSYTENRVAETSAGDLYITAQKHFASELGRERRETGCNDAAEVAAYTEKDSAASLLLLFRLNDVDRILGKTPNLTNIRSVKFDQVIKAPGEDYLRFLMDWYNSVTH